MNNINWIAVLLWIALLFTGALLSIPIQEYDYLLGFIIGCLSMIIGKDIL